MPRKTVFTRDEVLKAAYSIADSEGMEFLTARRIAKELHSSTAPVYSTFPNIEALKHEVIKMAKDSLYEYSIQPYTERVFLNIGTGIAVFSREHPLLYKALFLENTEYEEVYDEFLSAISSRMKEDPRFVDLPEKATQKLLKIMWTYTQGLATSISVGFRKNNSNESIINELGEVGGAVIASIMKANKKQ